MDAVTSYGLEFPVSVWMKKVKSTHEPRVIVVIEPVERCSAHFTLNEKVWFFINHVYMLFENVENFIFQFVRQCPLTVLHLMKF